MSKQGTPSTTESTSEWRWVILGLAFTSQFTVTLAAQVVPPLAPLLQSELALSKTEIGFLSSAVFAGSWLVLLGAGYLTERFGVRWVMSLGQTVAGCVMMTMAIAGSFLQAVFIMFLVGLLRGMVHPGSSKAIMDWFPARERATAMGIKQTGYSAAGILLAAFLPALALTLGWRHAVGLVGLIITAGGIITAVMYRDPPGFSAATQRGVSMMAGLRKLVRNQKLWVLSLTALMLVSAQAALVAYTALYFSDVLLVSSLPDTSARIIAAGGFLALLQVGGVVGRVGWGVVSDRLFPGHRMAVLAMAGAVAGIMALVTAFASTGFPFWLLAVLVFSYGASGLGWSGLHFALVVETAGQKHAAMAVGLCMTITQAGVVGGAPLFGLAVDLTGSYQVGWVSVGCLSLCAAILAHFYSRRDRREARR